MATSPFTIAIYDKTFTKVGYLGDPRSVNVNPRFNDPTAGATVDVDNDHRMSKHLNKEGCRLTFDYLGKQIMSGYIVSWDGDGDPDGKVTLTVQDDFSLFSSVLGWQVPTGTLQQNVSSKLAANYYSKTGPAETVVKDFVQKNAIDRLGLPVVCATDQGRGDSITVKIRMHPLYDRLFPAVTDAGIGVTVRQDGDHLVVDCYEPQEFPVPITRQSGLITGWSWAWDAPTCTRTIAGGQGEAANRNFVQSIDAMAEATWNRIIETFTDANDVDNDADLIARALQSRREGRRRTGLSLKLTESQKFKLGKHLNVGDLVTETLFGDPTQHVLTEAVLAWDADNGFEATPAVGDLDTVGGISRRRARAIAGAYKILRNIGASR